MKLTISSQSLSANKELISSLEPYFSKIIVKDSPRFNLYTELQDSDYTIVGLDKISDQLLQNCPKLKGISKYGVGIDNIDLDACTKRNIKFSYSPGINKRSVSELTLGFMLGLARNSYFSSYKLKEGIWNKNGGFQLSNKTIGIIGCGSIGKDLISLLKPFQCKILVNDVVDLKEFAQEQNITLATKDQIYQEAEIISIHTPLNEETFNLFNLTTMKKLKNKPFLINTARGSIINERDLVYALEKNIISGAALDCYEDEPLRKNEIYSHPKIITTPHIGGNAREAVHAMGEAAVRNLLDMLSKQ